MAFGSESARENVKIGGIEAKEEEERAKKETRDKQTREKGALCS